MPRIDLASVRDLARSSLTGVVVMIGNSRGVIRLPFQLSSAATSAES